MTAVLRLALAQLNFCVGDIDGNTAMIVAALAAARANDRADVIAFPELAITGYPPEDLLFRPALHERVPLLLRQRESEDRETADHALHQGR